MPEELKNRLKSFAWRLGSFVVVSVIAFLLENEGLLNIPSWGVIILSLLSAEITKFLNK